MKYQISIITLLLTICTHLFSQRVTRDLVISIPDTIIHNSLYNKISLIDSRNDTTFYGIVQWGLSNRKARVIARIPISLQVKKLLGSVIDSTQKDGELFLNIRQYSVAEITDLFSEHGYCMLRAELYAKERNRFKIIELIDTVWSNSAIDVTKDLLKNSGKLLSDFIVSNLAYQSTDTISYSLSEIKNIDSIEKSKILLYTTSKYNDGLYLSYESFRNQKPDRQILYSKRKDGSFKVLEMINPYGTYKKIKGDQSYAMILNGEIFIGTSYGFYPLTKINNDFIFNGKANTSISGGQGFLTTAFFGIIGGLIASEIGSESTYEMKLDHLTGSFVHVKKLN